jgi:hypothetical protein
MGRDTGGWSGAAISAPTQGQRSEYDGPDQDSDRDMYNE